MTLPAKLAFVDIETTGTRSMFDRIIEIGIILVENGKITKTYNSLVNPNGHIPPEIIALTGITNEQLETAPSFKDISHEVHELLTDNIFVAHNVRFDYSFLKSEFKRNNISYTSKHFCTVKLSRFLFPRFKHHNLDSLIDRFGFDCVNRHRALDDAKVITDFYLKMQKEIPEMKFTAAMKKALLRPTIPLLLSEEDLDNVPELPGVYVFYSDKDVPLYIGKSKNIRARVLSHFSSDLRRGIEMRVAQQVKRIETTVTAGELGALFIESQMIKELFPLYNKMLRLKQELTVLETQTDKNDYLTIKITNAQEIDPHDTEKMVGFFKSRKQAKEYLSKLAKEYALCAKLLGLESPDKSNRSACFGYRLETCKGACVGKEPFLFYNLRATAAFFKTKIRPWPFQGPVCIKEQNDFTGMTEYFVIDKWCYIGKLKIDNNESEMLTTDSKFLFDLDNYRIIERYLRSPRNEKNIRKLNKNEIENIRYYQSTEV